MRRRAVSIAIGAIVAWLLADLARSYCAPLLVTYIVVNGASIAGGLTTSIVGGVFALVHIDTPNTRHKATAVAIAGVTWTVVAIVLAFGSCPPSN